jgi:hypothetical protein
MIRRQKDHAFRDAIPERSFGNKPYLSRERQRACQVGLADMVISSWLAGCCGPLGHKLVAGAIRQETSIQTVCWQNVLVPLVNK